jgi:hypothetical protein
MVWKKGMAAIKTTTVNVSDTMYMTVHMKVQQFII